MEQQQNNSDVLCNLQYFAKLLNALETFRIYWDALSAVKHCCPMLFLGAPKHWPRYQFCVPFLAGGLDHFFIFPYIGNNHPNWLMFFRGFQTTSQIIDTVISRWVNDPYSTSGYPFSGPQLETEKQPVTSGMAKGFEHHRGLQCHEYDVAPPVLRWFTMVYRSMR